MATSKPANLSSSHINSGLGDLEDYAKKFYTKLTDGLVRQQDKKMEQEHEKYERSQSHANEIRTLSSLGIISVTYTLLRLGFERSRATSALISLSAGAVYFNGMDQNLIVRLLKR